MKLVDVVPDVEVLCALELDELGLRMLPALASWQMQNRFNEMTLEIYLSTVLGDHGHQPQYPPGQRMFVEEAIREAWAWLEGAALLIKHRGFREPNYVRSLSRRARLLAQESSPQRLFPALRIPPEAMHRAIRESVWALYQRGKYDTAIFEAMKGVEVAVREAAGLTPKDIGIALMRKAFDAESGPLTDVVAEKAERQARSDMFAGAIGSYKNPHSHRNVALDDPDEAAEIIMIANHLLRVVDACRLATR